MKSNDFLSEDIASDAHEMHLDHEVQMARKDCYAAADDAIALHKLLRNVSEQQGLEGWVAAKITLASDYLNTVREHLEYQLMSQVQPDSMEFPVAEGAMPAAVIRVKEKIRLMSAEEKKEYFRGKTREQLQKMARSHGYGENSDVYAKYATETVAEGMGEFDKVRTSPYEARQMLGGKYPVRFAIEVLLPDQSVVSMIQKKLGRAYNIERDDSIEGNGIGIEIVSRRFEGGQTAQAAYDQLLDFIEQNGGQFNSSTQVTIYKQKQGMAEAQLDEKCWDGYQQQGMKNKGNRQVPNCVPVTEDTDPEIEEMYEAMEQLAEEMAATKGVSVDLVWESFEALDDHMLYETAAWRRKEGKSARGGLNAKGVASYRRENPGSKLQTAVTTKPSKLKPGSKAAKRRKSFCARMGGVKGPMKKPNGKPTRKALALRKWNC